MSIAVTCPQCQARFDVPDDLADQPIQCHQCLQVFERGSRKAASIGIQAGPARVVPAPASLPDESAPSRPLHHPEPRSPFPVVPLMVVLIGLLFFLLVASVGFNVWITVTPDNRFRIDNRLQQAQADAQQQRAAAFQAKAQGDADLARLETLKKKEIDDLRKEIRALHEQLEEARRENRGK